MINIPKGTKDVSPFISYKWHYLEDAVRKTAADFGFTEIRTPTFEHTELFLRGVGETTDIVNKEMYTFLDKGSRSVTLKPEGTAGVARAYIEGGYAEYPQPVKMYYLTPVFRYERPQAGRLREHHQFGVELYGSASPFADAEVMILAKTLFSRLGLTEPVLNINSIGCPECRKTYNVALREYLGNNLQNMCASCRERFDKNPLRILDCKEPGCRKITAGAPRTIDYLCDDCKSHFEKLQSILRAAGIEFKVNPSIVRGLDYYTGTVFEFISDAIGAQGTVCGGGRYNNLVSEVGGKPTPAVGFGMGLERLLMILENLNLPVGEPEIPVIYIAPASEADAEKAFELVNALRSKGISADSDLVGRSLKAQMKYAGKRGYKFTAVFGGAEEESGKIKIKRMEDGSEYECAVSEMAEVLK